MVDYRDIRKIQSIVREYLGIKLNVKTLEKIHNKFFYEIYRDHYLIHYTPEFHSTIIKYVCEDILILPTPTKREINTLSKDDRKSYYKKYFIKAKDLDILYDKSSEIVPYENIGGFDITNTPLITFGIFLVILTYLLGFAYYSLLSTPTYKGF